MRRIEIIRGDFPLFHHDINPQDYEFFRTHSAAFKRMWQEQKRAFWSVFIDTYDDFIWNYGSMKDFPLKIEDKKMYVADIITVLRTHFVEGNASSARSLVLDCVVLAQNRHHVNQLDKGSYSQNPFYMKETREAFRKLFGPPKSKSTFVKLLCGIPVYVKFAGTAITTLRRWLTSVEIEDSYLQQKYLDDLAQLQRPKDISDDEDPPREKTEVEKILEGFDPELESMINELAPHGHQKLIFRHGPDDEVPKILGVSNGPMQLGRPIGSITDGRGNKKKKKKRRAKPPKGVVSEVKPEISPDQLIDLKGDPDIIVQKVDCDTDLIMPDGRVMKPPFTFIIGKGEKPDPAILKASLDKYNRDEELLKQQQQRSLGFHPDIVQTPTVEEIIDDEDDDDDTATTDVCTDDVSDSSSSIKYKQLHQCGTCNKMELEPKTFKRCIKCRGSVNPKYYCSKDCQVTDWKSGHRLEHKDS